MDGVENTFQIANHLAVPETDHPIAFVLEPPRADLIVRRDVVTALMPAVAFDDQSSPVTHEIDDVPADRCLTAEVRILHRHASEVPPKPTLGRGYGVTQSARTTRARLVTTWNRTILSVGKM